MRRWKRKKEERGGKGRRKEKRGKEEEVRGPGWVLIGRGKILAQGTKAELLRTAGTFVRAEDPARLAVALKAAGITSTPSADGFRSEVEPIEVGRAAAAAAVVLTELRPAEGAGLEELFLELTADDAREPSTTWGSPKGASA